MKLRHPAWSTRERRWSARTLAILVLVLTGSSVAASPVDAGYFETDDLSECVGHTEQDLRDAPEGTELPYGGVRVYRKDAQKGASHAWCLTMFWFESQGCCWTSADITLPPGLRRDAESLRFIAAPSCLVRVDFHPRTTSATIFRRQLGNGATKPRTRDKEISERFDDRGYGMDSFLSCWGGET